MTLLSARECDWRPGRKLLRRAGGNSSLSYLPPLSIELFRHPNRLRKRCSLAGNSHSDEDIWHGSDQGNTFTRACADSDGNQETMGDPHPSQFHALLPHSPSSPPLNSPHFFSPYPMLLYPPQYL